MLNLFLLDREGALLENAVAVWLSRNAGEEVCYLKSASTGLDVDFYVPSARVAVQVCTHLNDSSSEREIGGLLKAKANMPEVERLVIVTSEGMPERHPKQTQIEIIPIDLFLLKGFACTA